MNYISVYDNITNKRLCFLENAYNISYTLNKNGLATASFELPAEDVKNLYCKPFNYIELFDNDKRVELFRIVPSSFMKNANSKIIKYECEHVLATLIDDVLFGFHTVGNTGTYTPQSIRYVLDRQIKKRWNLQECDFTNQFLYTWENENLLSSLFSISKPLSNDFVWKYDTTNMDAWQLSLKKVSIKQKGEIRYKKNMQNIIKSTNPTQLCTRLYLLGYGEGDNQLNIKGINNGLPYIDSPNINIYGVISKVVVDRRFQDENSLLSYGKKLLSELDKPYISYEINATEIDDNVNVGDYIRVIDDEEEISEIMPIINIQKTDITGTNTIKYTIANKSQDITGTITDLSDRQRINELYSQGSVNIDSATFADNADALNPATLRFFISDKVVRVNNVNFTYSLTPFRAYSKSASASGGSSQTSSSGGGTSTSTEPNKGEVRDYPYTDYAMPIPESGMPITLLDHCHWFPTDEHYHDFSISSHSHSITIPDHTHEIEYGIFNAYTGATNANIFVDDKDIGIVKADENVDIAKYLSTDNDGKIQRGVWHTVQIVPNTLTRIEASIQNIVFINPKGGNDL